MSWQRDFLSRKISDPLAKVVSDLSKEEFNNNFQIHNIDSLNVQSVQVETKTKTNSKDKFHISIKPYAENQNFFNAVYPDYDDLRLWLKGENSDRLRDYSLRNNEAYLWSNHQVAEIYTKDSPDNMAQHEIVSYVNGTHYVRAKDNPILRLVDIVTNEVTKDGFTIVKRFNPVKAGISNQRSVILSQKIDSSQNRYGHSINMDNEGNIYFYVKYNYRQYFCKLNSFIDIVQLQDFGSFRMENFKTANFKTEALTVLNKVAEEDYDIACRFDFATKECNIIVTQKDSNGVSQVIASASSLSGTNSLPPNLQLHLPLQEGKWSETKTLPNNLPMNQIFDSSQNNLVLNISNPDATGVWNEDNTFTNNGNLDGSNTFMTIPNGDYINTLSEMTWCFWAKRNDTIPDNTYHYIVNKGWANNGGFVIYHRATSNNIVCEIKTDAGISGFVTRTNGMPVLGEWYFVTVKWKSGEAIKISINNDVFTSGTVLTGTLTNASNPTVYHGRAFQGNLLEVMFFNRQLLDSEVTTVYQYGAHLAQFPTNLEPQRLVNPAPQPITNPVVTIYDLPKQTTPVQADYVYLNEPQLQNPFVKNYDCPDGTSESIPLSSIYNIALGQTTEPAEPEEVYNHTDSGNSFGELFKDNNSIYAIKIRNNLVGKTIVEWTFYVREGNGNPSGTIYGRIWAAQPDGSTTKTVRKTFPQTFNAPNTTDWTAITFSHLESTLVLNDGDFIGIEWAGTSSTSDIVDVRRNSSTTHNDGIQAAFDNDWNDDTSRSPVAILKAKAGTQAANPYLRLFNDIVQNEHIGERFHSTATSVIGEPVTQVEVWMYKSGTVTSGNVICQVFDSNWNVKAVIESKPITGLPTVGTKIMFQNFNNSYLMQPGDVVAFSRSGFNSNAEVWVGYNLDNTGGGNNYDGSNSYIKRYETPFFGNGGTKTHTGNDISMQIWTGGNNFVAHLKFSETNTRIYERCVNANSSFYDKPLSRVVVRGERFGNIPNPSTLFCYVRNQSNEQKYLVGSVDANSIPTGAYNDVIFTNNNNLIKISIGDYVSIEISTCNATNYIQLNINKNVVDGDNSIAGKYENSTINDLAIYDLAGQFYTGGQIDTSSRTRVGQYIANQNSLFLNVENNQVTIVEFYVEVIGAPVGTVYVNIRRGSDDSIIKALGQFAAGSITGTIANPELIHVEDFFNTYNFAVDDLITVEFEGGDSMNQVGVLIRTSSPNYDSQDSYVARFNGVDYDYIQDKDLVSKIQVGGNTFTPEPNAAPPVLPENSTDWFINNNSDLDVDRFEKSIFNSFWFFTKKLTNQELLNLNTNRIDTGDHELGEIQVTNHSFIRNE